MESDGEEEMGFLSGPPFLRLYEKDENCLRNRIWLAEHDDKDTGKLSVSTWNDPRLYVFLRFFDTIEGFHKGTLDLSGRHFWRYEKIMKRFHELTSDLLIVSTQAIPFEAIDDWAGEPRAYTDYKFVDEKVWTDFSSKWGLPRGCDYSWLLAKTHKTLSTLSQTPSPKFQQLHLINLPTELLEVIMDHASIDQARLLSATCQELRRVGLRFIYHIRTLHLEANPDWKLLREQPVEGHYSHLHDAALASRSKFLDASGFLLSRTDLMEALGSLHMQDGWSHRALRNTPAKFFDILSLPEFYAPIRRDLIQVLYSTKSLTKLSLSGMDIWPELLTAISRIETLHTLYILSCKLDAEARRSLLGNEMPLHESVINLRLFCPNDDTPWYTLLLFPKLRTLSVEAAGFIPETPLHDIMHRANPFKTLERFALERTNPGFISFLSSHLSDSLQNTSAPYPNLTHFKIQTRFGITDAELSELLDGLRLAPNLQVLVLEGLLDVGVGIIDYIAEACPNLLGLTLIRRCNERQHETKLTKWPHPSADYASCFSSFPKLCYFAWNFRVSQVEHTPAIMMQFEGGFPDLRTKEGRKELEEMNNIAYFDDIHLMAALFSTYCSTLKMFAFVGRLPYAACKLYENADGGTSWTTLDINETFGLSRMWDTDVIGGWPNVTPRPLDGLPMAPIS